MISVQPVVPLSPSEASSSSASPNINVASEMTRRPTCIITTGAGCSAMPKPRSALHTRLLPAAETARVVIQGGGVFWVRILAADARTLILNKEPPALQLFSLTGSSLGAHLLPLPSFRPVSGPGASRKGHCWPVSNLPRPRGRHVVDAVWKRRRTRRRASQLAGSEHPNRGNADQGLE